MIFMMALLGAITRLTESGLSITEWAPITGVVPPHTDRKWNDAFHDYQQIPQYRLLHRDMSLEEFKRIYFWEWLHRLWGRLIGAAFAAPFVYFLMRGHISKKLGARLAVIFSLGALQGLIGWYMVESGLAVRTSVSPYRLSLHLNFALFIYGLLLWTALDFFPRHSPSRLVAKSIAAHGWIGLLLLAFTLIWGAFVAGLHAGEAYNTWPLMEGELIPSAAFTILPKWHNAFENLALVQFIHRWLGPATVLVILFWVWRRLQSGTNRQARNLLLLLALMALVQAALGIATLLTRAESIVAVLHQAGAITLLTLLLVNLKRMGEAGVPARQG
jgi:cytochrome c oxidase assembly protein subunit 15